MPKSKLNNRILTLISNLFFAWVLLHFGMGGWEGAVIILTQFGSLPWIILGTVLVLVFFRSDWRTDLPLFMAGLILGYWGEWWGTTRGVWTYWNLAQPPMYLPPLWGIGLITVYRLGTLFANSLVREFPRWVYWAMGLSFIILPITTFAVSWPRLAAVSWRNRLDYHFFAGLMVSTALIMIRFDLKRDFPLFICGTLLGGLYEYLGTFSGEWSYITAEVPPLWIAPLWGLASVAMTRLAFLLRLVAERLSGLRRFRQQEFQDKGCDAD